MSKFLLSQEFQEKLNIQLQTILGLNDSISNTSNFEQYNDYMKFNDIQKGFQGAGGTVYPGALNKEPEPPKEVPKLPEVKGRRFRT